MTRSKRMRLDRWGMALRVLLVGCLLGLGVPRLAPYVDGLLGVPAAWWLNAPLLVWLVLVLSRRLHDLGRSAGWLLLMGVPVVGPLCLLGMLGRRGQAHANRFGPPSGAADGDHLEVR